MRGRSRLLLLLITAIALLAILINLPKQILNVGRDLSLRRGLDLAGGTMIALRADVRDVPKPQRNNALDSAKTVIERRVNFFGVAEPVVQTAVVGNDYRIIVELPGITNVEEAVSLVGRTARLEFRELQEASSSSFPTVENTKPTGLGGKDLEHAQASFDRTRGQPVVLFRVADQSQEKFFTITGELKGKRMAIFLDEQFVSAPLVQEAIRNNGQISGNFTTAQARELALQLNAGALPVPLSILEQRTVGATLGEASLNKSYVAAGLGIVTIIVFMVTLYGKLGAIASVSLGIYVLIVLSLFRLIPVTLTLSGIAGFVLSIGMAVDANILIFERMREEIRSKKPLPVAMELGFQRAWSSIRDSNVASIITSLVLFYFGSSIVRGFAVTLLIGVLVSMFSAITVTRTFLRLVYR